MLSRLSDEALLLLQETDAKRQAWREATAAGDSVRACNRLHAEYQESAVHFYIRLSTEVEFAAESGSK